MRGKVGPSAVAALCVCAALPATAAATTTASYFAVGSTPPAGVENFGLLIHGDGATDNVTVRLLENPAKETEPATNPMRFRIGAVSATLAAGPGCATVSGGLECGQGTSSLGTFAINASLGAGDDHLSDATRFLDGFTQVMTMHVNGGPGNDEIRGGHSGKDTFFGEEGNDTLEGGTLADVIEGGPGDDTITGGEGADTLNGGEGNDTINARDGIKDASINCGAGTDKAVVDLADATFLTFGSPKQKALAGAKVLGCETVEAFAIDDGPPAHPASNAVKVRAHGASLQIKCPATARVRCHGHLYIGDPKHATKYLASAAYTIGLGATRLVSVRLSSADGARLRAGGGALATIIESGVSKKGPRSSQASLKVN